MVRENVSGALVQLGRGSQEDRSIRDSDRLTTLRSIYCLRLHHRDNTKDNRLDNTYHLSFA